jgi:hypothetical protein
MKKRKLKPVPLPQPTIEDLQRALWRLNVLNAEAAAIVGVSERTIYRYLSGDTPIPFAVLRTLELTFELRKKRVAA